MPPPTTARKPVIFQVRCPRPRYFDAADEYCNARLFDSRFPWARTSVDKAIIIVRCWRCHKITPLRPLSTDEALA